MGAGAPQLRLREIDAAWVAQHRQQLTLVDLRSAEEFYGPEGRIADSLLLPLPALQGRSGEIPSDRPLVLVCHSGRQRLANLRGALSRWRA